MLHGQSEHVAVVSQTLEKHKIYHLYVLQEVTVTNKAFMTIEMIGTVSWDVQVCHFKIYLFLYFL